LRAAERLRLLFLRAAMLNLPRDADPRRRVRAILRSTRNSQQARCVKSRRLVSPLACRPCVYR
jgi:hypothetical protein